MHVRYATLRSSRWTRLWDAAQAWQAIAGDLATKVAEFDRTVVAPVNDPSWCGDAAEAARAKVRQVASRMVATQKYLDANAQLMQAAYDGIWTAWQRTTDSWATPPAEVTMNDDGRVSFDSAPDTVDWYYPPIVAMMESQALAYQALEMADVVNRNLAPLMWYPPNRSVEDIPPVADADEHLGRVHQTWQKVKAELSRIAVDEPPFTDTPPQPRGDIPPDEERDKGMWLLLRMAADYLSLSGRPHGADLLKHWLLNSGTTQYVSPTDIRRDVPKFDTIVRNAINAAPEEGCFDTGWQPTDVLDENNQAQSDDWWYAFNHFRYRVAGRSIVINTGRSGLRRTYYTIGIVKPYVFGPPRDPIKIPYTGEEIDQAEIERLHHVGYAQNFIVQGLSHGTA